MGEPHRFREHAGRLPSRTQRSVGARQTGWWSSWRATGSARFLRQPRKPMAAPRPGAADAPRELGGGLVLLLPHARGVALRHLRLHRRGGASEESASDLCPGGERAAAAVAAPFPPLPSSPGRSTHGRTASLAGPPTNLRQLRASYDARAEHSDPAAWAGRRKGAASGRHTCRPSRVPSALDSASGDRMDMAFRRTCETWEEEAEESLARICRY